MMNRPLEDIQNENRMMQLEMACRLSGLVIRSAPRVLRTYDGNATVRLFKSELSEMDKLLLEFIGKGLTVKQITVETRSNYNTTYARIMSLCGRLGKTKEELRLFRLAA